MTDEIADTSAPVADTSTPSAAPEKAAEPPSRRDAIVAAVEAQKERAATADTEQPAKATAPVADRARAPDGKFVPSTDKPLPDTKPALAGGPTASPPVPAKAPGGEVAPQAADPADAPRPPPGWSPASKVAFDNLPEPVKADIAKREREVNQGLAKLAEYKPVEKYVEMARRGGTTLDRALENYTGIEQLLRRDVFAGVEQILRNVGVNPDSFFTAYQNRRAGGPSAPQADPAARQQAIDPNDIIRQATEAVRAEYEVRQIKSDVQRFAADPKNRFYENVKPQMAQLVQSGIATTIQEAYDKACRMDPEISRLINQTPAPDQQRIKADQARSANKATIGAPANGQSPGKLGLPANATRRQIMQAEIDRQKGARA